VAGGFAYAAIPDEAGVIHGCYRTSTDDQKGQLRVVESAASCRSNELPIEWNVTGAPGAQGPAGEDGADGADGTSPTVSQLGPGNGQCDNGGAAITDAAGTTAYVCSGANGQAGADGDPFSGTFTSPNGQYSISVTDSGVSLASPDSSIVVAGSAITIETLPGGDDVVVRSRGDFDLRSDLSLMLRAGTSARLESGTALDLRAGSTALFQSSGGLSVRGSLVNINGPGCMGAARVGDLAQGIASGEPGPVMSTILTGSPTVCIG
jgi:hypothetical protein